MTPSQALAVIQARALFLRLGVRPENIRVDVIPEAGQLWLPYYGPRL